MREAFVEFELKRIVSGIRVRRGGGAYALILRERAEGLGDGPAAPVKSRESGERLLNARRLCGRGIDIGAQQRGAQAVILGTQFVDTQTIVHMGNLVTHVSRRDQHLVAELMLESHVPLLRVGNDTACCFLYYSGSLTICNRWRNERGMAEVLREAAIPVERGGEARIGTGETGGDGESRLRPPDAFVDVLLIENAVAAAQNSVLHEIVGEANARREVVVMRVEKLRPTLAPGAISAENISTQQVAGAWIRYRGIHVRKPAQRIGRWRLADSK